MSSNKGVSHTGNSQIAHAEAALGAGRPYEKAHEGHNEMFNSVKELEAHHNGQGHVSNKQSRGERIDNELEQEDKKIIEKMNEAHKQKEEAHKHHNKD